MAVNLNVRNSTKKISVEQGGPLMSSVHDFVYAQLAQAAQAALCSRVHPTEPRLAKWILTTADVVESHSLHLTQEFLAQMIGAERSIATIAAGALKRAGLIDYRRGLAETRATRTVVAGRSEPF